MNEDVITITNELQSLLNGAELPDNRKNTKPQNIMWLLNNLRVRNRKWVQYERTMKLLAELAKASNLTSVKKLELIIEHINQ